MKDNIFLDELIKKWFTEANKSEPAPPKDRIKGSPKNKKGSSSKPNDEIKLDEKTESSLQSKVEDHNKKYGNDKGKKVTLGMLKSVWRRGAGAYSTSHRPGVSRSAWAMARVNAFLHLVRTGSPKNSDYITDNDLLPNGHPKK